MTQTPIEKIETAEVLSIRTEGEGLAAMAWDLVVTETTMGEASDLLGWIAGNNKRLEAQRVSLVKPLNDHVKFINGQFRDWMEPLKSANEIVREKVLAYTREQARIAAEAQAVEDRRIRTEQARLAAEEERVRAEQARLEAEAEAANAPPPPPLPPPPPTPPVAPAPVPMRAPIPAAPEKTTRSVLATTTIKKVWQYEITDADAVPREYLAVNEKKIAGVVRAGLRSIAGVRIFEAEQLAVRSR